MTQEIAMKEVETRKINFSTQEVEQKQDLIAEERPLHIYINGEQYVTILCSPDQLKELAIGHLLSEGILRSLDEVKKMGFDEDGRFHFRLMDEVDIGKRLVVSNPFNRIIFSTCGSSPAHWQPADLMEKFYFPKVYEREIVNGKVVLESLRNLNNVAKVFRSTGGVHVAALYSFDGNLLALAEDIGRHSAVDKVVGVAAEKGLRFERVFLASSGRLSGDIVSKAARLGIPIVASMAAALSSGLGVAKAAGITLIAFVRGSRMNVLTYPDRIKIDFQ